jgi:outer membrane protein assembly factor BamB
MAARTTFLVGLVTVSLLLVLAPRTETQSLTPSQGDVYVSLETGQVQWRTPDGTLRAVLVGQIAGPAEGMRFDEGGNLYVAHWCAPGGCELGNTIEKFDPSGVSRGAVGSGFNCNPHSIAFDAAGNAYVGLAACAGRVLKFSGNQMPVAYSVEPEGRRSLWIDLAGDGCTLFYTSQGPDVKRFDVCTNTELPNFNLKPMPGGETQGLRVLPDGGVLVSSGAVIARLDYAGALVQVYDVPTSDPSYWVGLDLVPNGTFWAVDSASSNVYQFDLATGKVRGRFNTGTPSRTPVDVVVRRAKTPSAPGGLTLR